MLTTKQCIPHPLFLPFDKRRKTYQSARATTSLIDSDRGSAPGRDQAQLEGQRGLIPRFLPVPTSGLHSCPDGSGFREVMKSNRGNLGRREGAKTVPQCHCSNFPALNPASLCRR